MQISIHTAPRVGCRCVVLQQSNIGTFGIWYYWLHWLPSMSGWVLGKLCQSTFLPLLEQSSMNPGSTAFGDPEDDRTWKWSPGCECKSQSYVACFLHVDAQILCMLYACCICVICGIVVWVQVCVCEVYECVQVCARLFLSRSLSRALSIDLFFYSPMASSANTAESMSHCCGADLGLAYRVCQTAQAAQMMCWRTIDSESPTRLADAMMSCLEHKKHQLCVIFSCPHFSISLFEYV